MPIEYSQALDVKKLADEIVESLGLYHVVPQFVYCVRSRGSVSRRTIARIHGFGKIWQETLHFPASYVIEVISERYDKLSEEDRERTIIHELLHIPAGFAGGFRPHKGYIDRGTVDDMHRAFKEQRAAAKTSF
ncbi:metallopeptidase [Candidatus Bathyarchaeota archaeon]|nr:metallopeptidase [Candidatus Bathyarchaeota archaeon]